MNQVHQAFPLRILSMFSMKTTREWNWYGRNQNQKKKKTRHLYFATVSCGGAARTGGALRSATVVGPQMQFPGSGNFSIIARRFLNVFGETKKLLAEFIDSGTRCVYVCVCVCVCVSVCVVCFFGYALLL
jgi:hypothetical protein